MSLLSTLPFLYVIGGRGKSQETIFKNRTIIKLIELSLLSMMLNDARENIKVLSTKLLIILWCQFRIKKKLLTLNYLKIDIYTVIIALHHGNFPEINMRSQLYRFK